MAPCRWESPSLVYPARERRFLRACGEPLPTMECLRWIQAGRGVPRAATVDSCPPSKIGGQLE